MYTCKHALFSCLIGPPAYKVTGKHRKNFLAHIVCFFVAVQQDRSAHCFSIIRCTCSLSGIIYNLLVVTSILRFVELQQYTAIRSQDHITACQTGTKAMEKLAEILACKRKAAEQEFGGKKFVNDLTLNTSDSNALKRKRRRKWRRR